MYKLYAKVRGKSVNDLVKAFFQDYKEDGSLFVNGEEAEVEIIFEQPPMNVIEVITQCELIEELRSEKYFQKEKDSELTKCNNKEEVKSTELTKSNEEEVKCSENAECNEEIANNQEIEEIAQKANSFENFAELIAEWLDVGKRKRFVIDLINAVTEIEKITWRNINGALSEKKVNYTQCDKILVSKQITSKVGKTILLFLKMVKEEYKNYPFESSADSKSEVNVKMECMPEIKEFEETLANIDKTQPIEERVRGVLNFMGLGTLLESEQKQIIRIVSVAVSEENIDFDSVCKKADISMEEKTELRMIFSKLINDFVSEYDKSGKNVKIVTFLSDLKEIII